MTQVWIANNDPDHLSLTRARAKAIALLMNTTSPKPPPVVHSLRCTCNTCCEARRDEVRARHITADAWAATATRGEVVRFESADDLGTVCSSLYLASAEPPQDPEGRIVLRGGRLLAESDPDRCAWVMTALGRARIEAEAHGDHMADVRSEWAEDAAMEREDEEEEPSWMEASR